MRVTVIDGPAQEVIPASSNRRALLLQNPNATATIYIGFRATVTGGSGDPSDGLELRPGATLTLTRPYERHSIWATAGEQVGDDPGEVEVDLAWEEL